MDSGVKQEAAAEPGDVIGAQGLECHAKEYEFDLVDSGNTLVLQMKGKTWAVRPRRRMCYKKKKITNSVFESPIRGGSPHS